MIVFNPPQSGQNGAVLGMIPHGVELVPEGVRTEPLVDGSNLAIRYPTVSVPSNSKTK